MRTRSIILGSFAFAFRLSDSRSNPMAQETADSLRLKLVAGRIADVAAKYAIVIDLDGTLHFSRELRIEVLTGVASRELPVVWSLEQNYPNPFNPTTTIHFALPRRSHVSLSVFNTLGQQIAQLVNGEEQAGYHEVKFVGSGLADGVYFYRLQGGSFIQTRKLLLIR